MHRDLVGAMTYGYVSIAFDDGEHAAAPKAAESGHLGCPIVCTLQNRSGEGSVTRAVHC